MAKQYERPLVNKIDPASTSKLGVSPKHNLPKKEDIDGVSVDELTKNHGSPLFVFSEKKIKEKYNDAYAAFSSRYENVQFAWSYKTNYLKGICALFHKMGSIAEVVSDFEYEKARALGIPGSDIIYNGPYKPFDSLVVAIEEGARIHIDNFGEILDIKKAAQKVGKPARVAIRINLNAGTTHQWSRFGFNLENGQAKEAIEQLAIMPEMNLTGLHTHIGTFMMDPHAYQVATKKMVSFFNEVEEEFNLTLEYLDMGGGLPSLSHLKGVYQPPEIAIPTVEKYAEIICNEMKNIKSQTPPMLIMETGRHLIDEGGTLVTSVVADKLLPDGRRSYVMDAGVNLMYTATWYNFKMEASCDVEGKAEPSIINGPLCMNIDVINEFIMLPRLERNTKLLLSPMGAYNITQSMQFIRYRPAAVLVTEDGETLVLKKAEDLEAVEFSEELPLRLRLKNEA